MQVGLILLMALGLNVSLGQYEKPRQPQAEPAKSSATLSAKLIDKEAKAQTKTATVEVTVTGVELVDPATVREQPREGQGHLHYQVDDGPVIATTAPKLSFHDLTSGRHKVVVTLVGNDHNPLGPRQTLEVTIP